MDYIASRGYDVYLLDLRGYGKSSRPKEMDQPPEANEPIVTTEVARRDVGAVVDHILQNNRRLLEAGGVMVNAEGQSARHARHSVAEK